MAYQFDHKWEQERARLAALEAVFDPHSKRTLLATGAASGWRCLEVGAGGGSIAQWLCDIVGPGGAVVATDVETKFLEAISPSLEVRRQQASFFDSAFASIIAGARATGFDPLYGRRLGAVFREAGLGDVAVEGIIFEWHGAHALARWDAAQAATRQDTVAKATSFERPFTDRWRRVAA